ncbi:MAG: type II toxin-antitoxin system CcdA family antitoxin [Actinomycetota bacterium]
MSATTKLSISLPADLAAEARSLARSERGGNLSGLIAELLDREVRRQRSLEAVAEWEAEHGALTAEELHAARRRWLA